VKPENLLVTRGRDGREEVKLMDFGLARLRDGEERNEITGSGALLGTPYYMAPEIIRGREADARSDIYALGAMLYRGLVGVPPYTGSSPIAVLTKTLTEDFVPPAKKRPDLAIPAELDALVCQCLAKDPELRPQRVEDVREALEAYLTSASGEVSSADLTRPRTIPPTGAGAREPGAVAATRDDVEAFERQIRRGRIAGATLFAVIVLALVAAAAVVIQGRRVVVQRATRTHDAEVEPNDAPGRATLIAPATEVRGGLGRRISRTQGDVDFFRLAPRSAGPQRLRIELVPQPNVDSIIEVFHSGSEHAVFVARESAVGEREVVAGLALQSEGDYFISVHEDSNGASVPTENVSDQYVLRYTIDSATDELETEPNDREELASRWSLTAPRRGYIENRQDEDCWCPESLSAPAQVTLAPPARMDLELVIVHHDGRAREVVDQHAAGDAEVATLSPEATRPPCVIVRGSQRNPPPKGDGVTPYTLESRPR
jgi:serine/threonine-protein kinase